MTSRDITTETFSSTRLRKAGLAFATATLVLLWSIPLLAQSKASREEQIPGTPLSVKVPQGWHLETAQATSLTQIVHDLEPRYSLSFSSAMVSDSCARRLAYIEKPPGVPPVQDLNRPKITLGLRPSFVPDQYAPLSAFGGRDVLLCMDLGSKTIVVALSPLGDNRDLILKPVLEAIAQAALVHADYISAPGPAKLPTLGVEVKLDSGQYFVKLLTLNGKPRDTIVRLNSEVPLEISFIELKPSDESGCSALYGPTFHFGVRNSPPFVSKRWYPKIGTWPAPGQLANQACYAASPQLLIAAMINYGKTEVGEQDERLIRELLDRVADSADRGPHMTGQVTETVSDFFGGQPVGGVIGGIIGGSVNSIPARMPNSAVPQRIRVSQGMSEGLLLKKIQPEYPSLARQARIQGTVLLQAQISKDGKVENLQLISGHPMLAPAAIEAVMQWIYKPYVLNGTTVAVETQVQVNFILSSDPSGASGSSGPTQPDGSPK
jgi:TonB family protein